VALEIFERKGALQILTYLYYSRPRIHSEILGKLKISPGTLDKRLKDLNSLGLIIDTKENRLPFERKISLTSKGKHIARARMRPQDL
jgi:DNA-binding HxlR family transcriptional regulator